MKAIKIALLALTMVLAFSAVTFAAVDTKNFLSSISPNYFTPNEGSTYSSPYYRWWNEDWSWQHDALSVTSSATLYIGAWDVDADDPYSPEIDNIYALDGVDWVLLGSLQGSNNAWGFSTFTLGSNFYDEIATGLNIFIDIDSSHSYDWWAVALSKSVLTTDGSENPEDPTPGVPEPATMMLLGLGLMGLAGLRRKIKK